MSVSDRRVSWSLALFSTEEEIRMAAIIRKASKKGKPQGKTSLWWCFEARFPLNVVFLLFIEKHLIRLRRC